MRDRGGHAQNLVQGLSQATGRQHRAVGLVEFGEEDELELPLTGQPYLWRYMVDERYQGLGFGREGLLQTCPPALQYRWMLEEFRVSLFAQHLGTRQAVSEKRLQQQWGEVSRWLEANPH